MDCPRCGGSLATFAVEATGKSAVVCESCGFAGVAASHEPEESDVESWERAIERFEAAGVPLDRSRRTRRADAVSVPTDDPDSGVDADALEESVTVAAALREDDTSRADVGDTDRDALGSLSGGDGSERSDRGDQN